MSKVSKYKCNECGFSLPSGRGGYSYVMDRCGNRINCESTEEEYSINAIISNEWGFSDYQSYKELIKSCTGFNSYCICLECLTVFEADISIKTNGNSRDPRKCPECGSNEIMTELELVGHPCPACNSGIIEEKVAEPLMPYL